MVRFPCYKFTASDTSSVRRDVNCTLEGLLIDNVLVTMHIKFDFQLVSNYSTFPTFRQNIDSFRADNKGCTVTTVTKRKLRSSKLDRRNKSEIHAFFNTGGNVGWV